MRQNKNRSFYIGGSGLDRTGDFQKFADQGWIGFNFIGQDWTRTEKFHSPLISAVLEGYGQCSHF